MSKVIAKFEKVSLEQYVIYTEDAIFQDSKFIEREYKDIKLPRRATKGSAGYDFFLPFKVRLAPNKSILIPTGIRCKMKEGFVLKEYPRSSLGFKYKIKLDNTVGIIDSDYYYSDNEGHIMMKLTNEGDLPVRLDKGTAFCQGVFVEYFLAEEEEVLEERNGGIGSTN